MQNTSSYKTNSHWNTAYPWLDLMSSMENQEPLEDAVHETVGQKGQLVTVLCSWKAAFSSVSDHLVKSTALQEATETLYAANLLMAKEWEGVVL